MIQLVRFNGEIVEINEERTSVRNVSGNVFPIDNLEFFDPDTDSLTYDVTEKEAEIYFNNKVKHLRIGFMGASGTGKTTLACNIHTIYGVRFVSGLTTKINNVFGIKSLEDLLTYNFCKMRPTPEEGIKPFNRGVMQNLYFLAYMDMENENSFVSDRTVIDVLAYSVASGNLLEDDDLDAAVNDSIKKYDLLFYCPRYAFVSDDDPKRTPFKEENKKVDSFLSEVCIENPKVIRLHQSSFEDRIKYICEVINAYVRKSGADNLCQSSSQQ